MVNKQKDKVHGTISHVFSIIKRLEEDLGIPNLHTQVFITGSSIHSIRQGLDYNDFDIVFRKMEDLVKFESKATATLSFPAIQRSLFDFNCEGRKLQFLLFKWGSPKEIIDTHDWSVANGYAVCSGPNEHSPYDPDVNIYISQTGNSIETKNTGDQPYSALTRLWKYLKRGWTFNDPTEQNKFIGSIIETSVKVYMEMSEESDVVTAKDVVKEVKRRDAGYAGSMPGLPGSR